MREKDQAQDENRLIAQRRSKLAEQRKKGAAFPNHFRRDALARDLQDTLSGKSKDDLVELNQYVAIGARIMGKRSSFLVLQDMTGRIQAYLDRKNSSESLIQDVDAWDIGDIVGVTGPVHKSGKGDLYVKIESAVLLTKSLRPLPEKFHGLTDQEQRYRQRYVDLIMNRSSREVLEKRTAIIRCLRQFLVERNFVEVETPMMQTIAGGAAARPFETYHNALGRPLYMRVAPELFLKRLVIGGVEQVFEINRNFRNEGLSTQHNPEFTMLEFYQAYADFHDLMDLTEEMMRRVCSEVLGTLSVQYGDETFDFSKPFNRMTVKESILHFNSSLDPNQLDTPAGAKEAAAQLEVPIEPNYRLGKIQIEIFEKTVEARLRGPTFITAFPPDVSPLARKNDDDPSVTARVEFIVGGREIANGFSELNDPEDQAERFRLQAAEKESGDEEAMSYDTDYIRALEYGLPPTAGEGIGVDRLVMLLTDSPNIRDVILFPQMKPESGS
ncbi:MAG: lysine--tRNA ligase [Proteobacteria bacterium]|nr:lysine--tRNA ligase [Pseudomonadota bacterium]